MKLRLAKNSVRFRLLRSEVETLRQPARLDESLTLGPEQGATLMFALESSEDVTDTEILFDAGELRVRISADRANRWAGSDEVGIYDHVKTSASSAIELLIEKDFACLDRSDAENSDTFENPNAAC